MAGEVSQITATVDVEEVLSLLTWDDFGSQAKTVSVFDNMGDDSDDEALTGGDPPVISKPPPEELEVVVAVPRIPQDDAAIDAALESVFSDIAREKAFAREMENSTVPARQVVRGSSAGVTFELTFEQLQKWNQEVMQVKDEEAEEQEESSIKYKQGEEQRRSE